MVLMSVVLGGLLCAQGLVGQDRGAGHGSCDPGLLQRSVLLGARRQERRSLHQLLHCVGL